MLNYSKEQIWDLYEELPQELKDSIFSEKNADYIYNSCASNGIRDKKKISEIAKNVGYVFLGLISPKEFQKTLKKLDLKKETAENIYKEINDYVFLPRKNILEKLYRVEISKMGAADREKNNRAAETRKNDPYRESIN